MTFEEYVEIIPINKGWSDDKKYCVTKTDGTRYLLRISPIALYKAKKAAFHMMERVAALGVPMCLPVDYGTCDSGCYTLQSWIDGEDAEDVIPFLPDSEAYGYGLKAGEMLQKIHSISAPEITEVWASRFNRKIDRKLQMYRECPVIFGGSELMIDYIEANRYLLNGRPQCFQHGDYHIGNMMLENGVLTIIDFDRSDYGDPWEEFNRIVWSAQKCPKFASGIVNAYFEGNPPTEFWRLLALYISSNTLSSLPWAIEFGRDETDTMLNQAKDVLSWYDGMKNSIPSWYSIQ